MTKNQKLDQALVDDLSKRDTDIKEHLWTLYNLVQQVGAKVVVELGAGQSTYVLAAAVKETGGQLWSIDQLAEAHLRGYPEGDGLLENEPRYHFIQEDSVRAAVSWTKVVDLLFIDTNHQREHTRLELEAWERFIPIGGKIAMHDTYHLSGHAVGCKAGLEDFLRDHPGEFEVRHIESGGGLSILTGLIK